MIHQVWDRLPGLLDTTDGTVLPEIVFEGTQSECERFIQAATFNVGIHPSRYYIEEMSND
jgi:hypothetical protein